MFYPCYFCKQQIIKALSFAKCNHCNITYLFQQNNQNNLTGFDFHHIKDDIVYWVESNFVKNHTEIQIHTIQNNKNQQALLLNNNRYGFEKLVEFDYAISLDKISPENIDNFIDKKLRLYITFS